jgi:hypothetical protein
MNTYVHLVEKRRDSLRGYERVARAYQKVRRVSHRVVHALQSTLDAGVRRETCV